MNQTQLQLRIMASVKNNTSYPINSYFIDFGDYRTRSFSDEPSLENCIKTGETFKDIRPAVQARLAQMDFPEVICRTANRYRNSNFLLKKYVTMKIEGIHIRNSYLIAKAMIKAIIRENLCLLGKNLHSFLIHEIYNLRDNIESSKI